MSAVIIEFPKYKMSDGYAYRNGFVLLTAYESDFNQYMDVSHNYNFGDYWASLTTKYDYKNVFEQKGQEFIDNTIKNIYQLRAKTVKSKIAFMALLPIPLTTGDNLSVEWQKSNSVYNDYLIKNTRGMVEQHVVGKGVGIWKGAIAMAPGIASGFNGSNAGDNVRDFGEWAGDKLGWVADKLSKVVGQENIQRMKDSMPYSAQFDIAKDRWHDLAMGINAWDAGNNAAALSGVRQVVNDPGYWQKFNGVSPRSITLKWNIIPENEVDAINGIELCARLKEFALPQKVSQFELLSPCIWTIDWSSKFLQFNTVAPYFVLTRVDVNFTRNAEIHGDFTPKNFEIELTFAESTAPNADVYKTDVVEATTPTLSNGYSSTSTTVGTGALSTNAITSLISSGSTGNAISNNTGNIISSFFGGGSSGTSNGNVSIWDTFANAASNLANGVQNLATNAWNSITGGSLQNLVNNAISIGGTNVGNVLSNAIRTGDFSNLGDKLKQAVSSIGTGFVDSAKGVLSNFTNGLEDLVKNVAKEDLLKNLLSDDLMNFDLNKLFGGVISNIGKGLGNTDIGKAFKNLIGEDLSTLTGNALSTLGNNAFNVIKDAIKTGNFDNLGDKLKQAGLNAGGDLVDGIFSKVFNKNSFYNDLSSIFDKSKNILSKEVLDKISTNGKFDYQKFLSEMGNSFKENKAFDELRAVFGNYVGNNLEQFVSNLSKLNNGNISSLQNGLNYGNYNLNSADAKVSDYVKSDTFTQDKTNAANAFNSLKNSQLSNADWAERFADKMQDQSIKNLIDNLGLKVDTNKDKIKELVNKDPGKIRKAVNNYTSIFDVFNVLWVE